MSDVPENDLKPAETKIQPLARLCYWMGLACCVGVIVGVVGTVLLWRGGNFSSDFIMLLVMELLVAPLTIVLSLVARFRTGNATSKRKASQAMGIAFACFLISFVVIPVLSRARPLSPVSPSFAVATMRTLSANLYTYASEWNQGFPDTLSKLGPPPPGQQPDANNADLLDAELSARVAEGNSTGFVRRGYRFTYTPGPPGQDGMITAYSITARPVLFGGENTRSFFIDESGAVRSTEDDREPTAQDQPL